MTAYVSSQGAVTADIPVVVNANATVTITPIVGMVGATGTTANVTANTAHTLTIVLSGGNVSISDRTQTRPLAPATVKYSRGNIVLGLNPQSFNNATISLYTVNGKQVLRGKADVSKSTSLSISRGNAAAGVYLLRIAGAAGNTYTTRLSHTGGRLNINAIFNGGDLSLRKQADAASDYGTWTITAWAVGYKDTSYTFSPISGINKMQNITLSSVGGRVVDPATVVKGTVTDPRDGNVYNVVKIGAYIWMAENHKYNASSTVDSRNSWCYNEFSGNCVTYGRLYGENAAVNACSGLGKGWRLPTREDWNALIDAVGGAEIAGTKLKSKNRWDLHGTVPAGTDLYSFSALPGGGFTPGGCYSYGAGGNGYQICNSASSKGLGSSGLWWVAPVDSFVLYMDHGSEAVSFDRSDYMTVNFINAFSVRCVQPPEVSAPTGVSASATSSSSITVSWSVVPVATVYYVYRSTSASGTYSAVGSSTTTSYTDSDLSANTTYYYKVGAYSMLNEAQSSYVSATTLSGGSVPNTMTDPPDDGVNKPAVPSAPMDVTDMAATLSSITISWSAVSGATEYRVYRSTSASGTYSLVGSSTTTSYTNTGLSANTTYYYKVAAYNSAGTGAQSEAIYATTPSPLPVPSAPTGVTATAISSSNIKVSWTAVSGATEYSIYRSTSASGTYSLVYGGCSRMTAYTDYGLSANTTYYYKVAACNSEGGVGAQSSYVSANTLNDVDPSTVVKGTMTDSRDGKTYKTVKIGEQTWMAENLNYKNSSWSKNDVTGSVATTSNIHKGSWYYDNDSVTYATYGRLYTWAAAMEACPSSEGWYLPTDAEWTTLENAVGGSSGVATKLKSSNGWYNNGNGTDAYGFSALPGGGRGDRDFYSGGSGGLWWTATENGPQAWYLIMDSREHVIRSTHSKNYGFAVRCIRRG